MFRETSKASNNIPMVEIYYYIPVVRIYLKYHSISSLFNIARRVRNRRKCANLPFTGDWSRRRLIENHHGRVSRRVIPILSVYIFFFFSFLWDWEKAERKEISAGIDESVTRRCKVFDIEVAMGMKGRWFEAEQALCGIKFAWRPSMTWIPPFLSPPPPSTLLISPLSRIKRCCYSNERSFSLFFFAFSLLLFYPFSLSLSFSFSSLFKRALYDMPG